MAVESGWFVIRSADVFRFLPLIPFRDLFNVAVWTTALFGKTVIWRDRRLRLDHEGKILDEERV
jgi:hypothetical protein